MTNELGGYDQIIVLDYSRTMLRQAQEYLGKSDRYVYVAANIYQLPLADGSCDAAVMERVIHHIADVPAALRQIRAVLAPGAPFVLEFASKRNLKAILRYALRRQQWSPFDPEPVEFVKLNFDFHPGTMIRQLHEAGFVTKRKLALSYLRLGLLKRTVPVRLLVAIDSFLQQTGQVALYSPSVFTLNEAVGSIPPSTANGRLVFKCLNCGTVLQREGDTMICPNGDGRWAVHDGIYDFKEPSPER
jgi:SAM-dependent methyltransferase